MPRARNNKNLGKSAPVADPSGRTGRRLSGPRRSNRPKQERTLDPERQARGALGGSHDYIAERTEWVRIQRRQAALRLAEREGRLLEAEDVQATVEASFRELVARYHAIPERLDLSPQQRRAVHAEMDRVQAEYAERLLH